MPEQPPPLFDRRRLAMHRNRASNTFDDYDFILLSMDERIARRLNTLSQPFPAVLNIGAHTGSLARFIDTNALGIETMVHTDLSAGMVARAPGLRLAADDEALPFAEQSFDLIVSSGSLHWANNFADMLMQVFTLLRPNGLFVAAIPGRQTLQELYAAFDSTATPGAAPASSRIAPFFDSGQVFEMLQTTGFDAPEASSELFALNYDGPEELLFDLRHMGETNILSDSSKHFMPPEVLRSAMAYYREQFTNQEGGIVATFEHIVLSGRKKAMPQEIAFEAPESLTGNKDTFDSFE